MKRIIFIICSFSPLTQFAQEDKLTVRDFDNLTFPLSSEINGKPKQVDVVLYESGKKRAAGRMTEFNSRKEFTRDIFSIGNEVESDVTRLFSKEGRLSQETSCTREETHSEIPSLGPENAAKYKLRCLYIKVRNNDAGLPLEKKYVRKDSSLDQRMTWKYNGKNQLLRLDTWDPKGKLIYRKDYRYLNGKKIEEFEYSGDTLSFSVRITFRYDANDSVVEKITYSNKSTSPDFVEKYNDKGLLSEYSFYANGELQYTKAKTYDEKGTLKEEKELDAKGEVTETIFFTNTYNGNGLLTERIEKDHTGAVRSKKDYVYDKYGNYTAVLIEQYDKKYRIKRKIIYY
ncbi:MAG: hypothetical protein ACJ77K_09550 [Bacteroidia bacterium]